METSKPKFSLFKNPIINAIIMVLIILPATYFGNKLLGSLDKTETLTINYNDLKKDNEVLRNDLKKETDILKEQLKNLSDDSITKYGMIDGKLTAITESNIELKTTVNLLREELRNK
jgi:hypothetical protein